MKHQLDFIDSYQAVGVTCASLGHRLSGGVSCANASQDHLVQGSWSQGLEVDGGIVGF